MASSDDRAQASDARNHEEAAARDAVQPLPLAIRRASVFSASGGEIIGTATRRDFRDLAAKLRREVVQGLWADAGFCLNRRPCTARWTGQRLQARWDGEAAVLVSLAAWSESQSLDHAFGPSGARCRPTFGPPQT